MGNSLLEHDDGLQHLKNDLRMAKVRLSRKFRTFLKMSLISAINPKNPRAQGHVHR